MEDIVKDITGDTIYNLLLCIDNEIKYHLNIDLGLHNSTINTYHNEKGYITSIDVTKENILFEILINKTPFYSYPDGTKLVSFTVSNNIINNDMLWLYGDNYLNAINCDILFDITSHKISKTNEKYHLRIRNKPKSKDTIMDINYKYSLSKGMFCNHKIVHNKATEGHGWYNEDGVDDVTHVFDEDMNYLYTTFDKRMALLFDYERLWNWINENDIQLDYYGNIKDEESLMAYRLKFKS